MATQNILALDGGGSKGIVTAVLIEELEKATGGFLDKMHFVAGTSIGAANAAAIAMGHPPADMVKFYRDSGCEIFGDRYQPPGPVGAVLSMLCRIPLLGTLIYKLENLFLPKWDNTGLKNALARYFGPKTCLEDVPGDRKLLITSMELSGHLPDFNKSVVLPISMTNFRDGCQKEMKLHEAVLRSMSAPTFFESHSNCVDGGMFAQNPCIAALSAAVAHESADVAFDQFKMISIGTGITDSAIRAPKPLRWGLLQWAKQAFLSSAVAVVEFDSFQAQDLMGKNFCRLNIALPHPFALDDCQQLAELESVARKAVATEEFKRAVEFIRTEMLAEVA